jgi:hypothetical protein
MFENLLLDQYNIKDIISIRMTKMTKEVKIAALKPSKKEKRQINGGKHRRYF